MLQEFEGGKKYIAKDNYFEQAHPLPPDRIKKGEVVIFVGKNLGFAKFRKEDGTIFTIDATLAFKFMAFPHTPEHPSYGNENLPKPQPKEVPAEEADGKEEDSK